MATKLIKDTDVLPVRKHIKIRYHADIDKLNRKGNFIDLRSAETVSLKAGDFKLINLGVSMQLPEGYWAMMVPRSSTFKTYGVIQTNSIGVIDNEYSGNDDIWMMPVYATRDTTIWFNDRIAQFMLFKDQGPIVFDECDIFEERSNNRGGFGSTGKA